MTDPVIAQQGPYIEELPVGNYWWCACGKSHNQPFCDGSHQGTGITPVKLELAEGRKVGLCDCKRSKNPPFCDGSHKDL